MQFILVNQFVRQLVQVNLSWKMLNDSINYLSLFT